VEFQEILSQDKNLIGKTVMVSKMKSSTLMVILLPGAPVKLISIRKLSSLGLLRQIKEIQHQYLTLLDSL